MATAPAHGMRLRDVCRVVRHVSAVCELRYTPGVQRRRVILALRELAGREIGEPGAVPTTARWLQWLAAMTGRPAASHCLRRLAHWLASGDDAVAGFAGGRARPAPSVAPAPARPGRCVIRLFVLELARLERAGLLGKPAAVERLTPRQQQVLACLLAGQSAREIGRTLGLGSRTVEQHMQVLYRKFNVHNRPQLMARWVTRAARTSPQADGEYPTP